MLQPAGRTSPGVLRLCPIKAAAARAALLDRLGASPVLPQPGRRPPGAPESVRSPAQTSDPEALWSLACAGCNARDPGPWRAGSFHPKFVATWRGESRRGARCHQHISAPFQGSPRPALCSPSRIPSLAPGALCLQTASFPGLLWPELPSSSSCFVCLGSSPVLCGCPLVSWPTGGSSLVEAAPWLRAQAAGPAVSLAGWEGWRLTGAGAASSRTSSCPGGVQAKCVSARSKPEWCLAHSTPYVVRDF